MALMPCNDILVFDEFREYLTDTLSVDVCKVPPLMALSDIGIDSLAVIEMIDAIELIGVSVDVEFLSRQTTIFDLHQEYARIWSSLRSEEERE